jgi:hypothetical protein
MNTARVWESVRSGRDSDGVARKRTAAPWIDFPWTVYEAFRSECGYGFLRLQPQEPQCINLTRRGWDTGQEGSARRKSLWVSLYRGSLTFGLLEVRFISFLSFVDLEFKLVRHG